jgi:hypothetical protein
MAPTAGFVGKLGITTTSTTMTSADYVQGVDSWSLNRGRELLETTNFKDTTADGIRKHIAGLRNVDGNFECDFEPTGDTPTTRIQTALDDGSSVWVQHSYNGTAGWKVEAKIEKADIKQGVGDKLRLSVAWKANGAVAAL